MGYWGRGGAVGKYQNIVRINLLKMMKMQWVGLGCLFQEMSVEKTLGMDFRNEGGKKGVVRWTTPKTNLILQ